MATHSRTYMSLRNSGVAMLMFLINFALQFYSRKIFLEYLGTEVLGLNTTATNLLQFLNLAELGISGAVGFTLYKPIHERDFTTINELVTLQKHLYRRIAYFVMSGAGILMCFFPLIFAKIQLPLWYAYGSFGVLLLSALLSYFVNYKQVVLTASQQDYLVQLSYKSVLMIKLLAQIFAVRYSSNGYVWWLILEGAFAILSSISLHYVTLWKCRFLKSSDKSFRVLRQSYRTFTTKVKQMFFHKIGSFALQQSSPLIIYAYASLTLVAMYGNYYMVIMGIVSLMSAVSNSTGAGVGDLVAEGNNDKIIKVFWELFSSRFLIVATFCFCAWKLIPSFVILWIGDQYLMPKSTLFLMIIILYVQMFRYLVNSFLDAYAMTRDIWAPMVEATINIGGSILLGKFWGLNGILLAVVISLVVMVEGWKAYFLLREGMIYPIRKYVGRYMGHVALGAAAYIISSRILLWIPFTEDSSSGWLALVGNSIIHAVLFGGILSIFLGLTYSSFRQFVVRLKRFVTR